MVQQYQICMKNEEKFEAKGAKVENIVKDQSRNNEGLISTVEMERREDDQ